MADATTTEGSWFSWSSCLHRAKFNPLCLVPLCPLGHDGCVAEESRRPDAGVGPRLKYRTGVHIEQEPTFLKIATVRIRPPMSRLS